jgi:hypothetical protein
MRSFQLRAVTLVLAGGFLTIGVLLPTALAKGTACSKGYHLRSVESLAATGNAPVPGQIDAAGNGDGSVCALPLPDAVCIAHGFDPCPVETVYQFRDNNVGGS